MLDVVYNENTMRDVLLRWDQYKGVVYIPSSSSHSIHIIYMYIHIWMLCTHRSSIYTYVGYFILYKTLIYDDNIQYILIALYTIIYIGYILV